MGHLPRLWYRINFVWWPRLLKNLTIFLDNQLALSVNVMMFLVPMFHDTSLLGRLLSLIVRLIKIIIGAAAMILSLAAMGVWWLIWLTASPLIFLVWPLDILRQLWLGTGNLDPAVKQLVRRSRGDLNRLTQLLIREKAAAELLTRLEIPPLTLTRLTLPQTATDWLDLAGKETKTRVAPEHLILAILNFNQWRYPLAVKTVNWLAAAKRWARTPFIWDRDYVIRPIGGVDRGLVGVPTPRLDRYSQDLTKAAQKRELPEMVGKTEAVNQLIKILSRKEKHHGLIIGEPGSGKTTLVKALAQEIVRGVEAKSLRFKRLVALDTSRLAAGADTAELTQRIEQVIDEIGLTENIILFVDEVHHLAMVNRDTPETSNLFRALEPVLEEGRLQFIGATTTENYKKYIEPNEAFARLFEIVELPEASAATSEALLEYLAWKVETEQNLFFTRRAIARIVELAQAYFHDRVLPDKAVNLLDEAAAQVATRKGNLITTQVIDRLVSEKTKVPVSAISQAEAKNLLNLEKKLHQQVIGQEAAVKAVAQALRRARTQLKNPNKPIAGFLFAGPTGVGKTETAKALAAQFFGSAKAMIRLDMSEYQTLDSVDRLLAVLTDAIRLQPYTLLLLDEVEKAHQKVINLFLQVLDDARLTSAAGKTADFSHTIIIATTNAKNIRRQFAPEWLNRFNAVIVFKTLTPAETEQVIGLKLNQLTKNLLKQEIKLEFDQTVAKVLARQAFSQDWGGREADRVIQNQVGNVIAEKILKGEIVKNQPYRFRL